MAVKQNGTGVTLDFDTEAEARDFAANAKARALDDSGFQGWIKRVYQSSDELAEMQPAYEFVGYGLLVLAAVMEYVSWSNLFPGKGLPVIFGLIGVCILFGTKFSFARWARAINNGHKKRQSLYSRCALIGIVICALMASQLLASQIENENQGAEDVRAQIAAKDQEINDIRSEVRMMQAQVSTLSSEDIKFEIQLLENEPATNSQGARTGQTVGEHVGDCIGSSYYKDTYCDGILELKRKLAPRESYEALSAKLESTRAKRNELQDSAPDTSGAVALGRQFSSGGDFIITIMPGVILMLIVVGAMGFFTFLSKWNPKDEVA